MVKGFRPAIILPTFNVEETVGLTLDETMPWISRHCGRLLVVDNASEDKTVEVFKDRLTAYGKSACEQVYVEERDTNLGYGASIKAGFSFFQDSDATHVIVLHSDMQTDNSELLSGFVRAVQESSPSYVIASRFLPESDISRYSLARRIGNYFFNHLTVLTTGVRTTDPGSAMVMIETQLLRQVDFESLPSDWRFHPALNLFLLEAQSNGTVEIPLNWKDAGVQSSVPLLRYAVSLAIMLIAYAILKIWTGQPTRSAIFRKLLLWQ